MVVHVYDRAKLSRLDDVVIATDDDRIAAAAREWGCRWVMTEAGHRTGSDRVAEVARESVAECVVNIQGDEPLLDPRLVDELLTALITDPTSDVTTARRPLDAREHLDDPNVTKVVVDRAGYALYFSRFPIPYRRENCRAVLPTYQHVGVYAYRRDSLLRLAALPPAPLELAESLEQLRALENGMKIRVIDTEYEAVAVDVPADITRVENLLQGGRA